MMTLTERKASETARRRAAVEALLPALAAYAQAHGGRYLLFGSAARGQMRYDSDVDLLLDFPPEALSAAWNYAETVCWDRALDPDLMPLNWCKLAFLDHIAPDLRAVPRVTPAGSKWMRR